MITAKRFRAMCLALASAEEAPHFDRAAFRVRKIFATLPPDGRTANLLLAPELQSAVLDAMPHAFTPVPGGWGRMGYTTVDLARVNEDELTPVLREAHALASEPPKKRRSKAPTRASSSAHEPSGSEDEPSTKKPSTKKPSTKKPSTKKKAP